MFPMLMIMLLNREPLILFLAGLLQHPRLLSSRPLLKRPHQSRLSNLSHNKLPRPPRQNRRRLITRSTTPVAVIRMTTPRRRRNRNHNPHIIITPHNPVRLPRTDLPLPSTNTGTMVPLHLAGTNLMGMTITNLHRLYIILHHNINQLIISIPPLPHRRRLPVHCLLPPTIHPTATLLHPLRIDHLQRITRILLQLILRRIVLMRTTILTLPHRCLRSTLTLNRMGTVDPACHLPNRLLPRVTQLRT